MDREQMVLAAEFCVCHNIELSFINSLYESGLIDVVVVKKEVFIPAGQLKQLEQLMRFKMELDINLEGMESITYLLQRIQLMQQHITELNNKLAFYQVD